MFSRSSSAGVKPYDGSDVSTALVGDVVLSIGSRKIASEDDLRQAIFKIGPGKTEYSYRRGSDTHTAAVDCPSCKAE